MNRILVYGTFGLLISCTAHEKSSQTTDTLAENSPTLTPDSTSSIGTTSTTGEESDEEDCVFDNNYEGLTTDWLAELKLTEFIWRDDLKQALVPLGQDTVFFSKGGCTHSGMLIELKLSNDDHALTDSAYWIEKALALSVEYRMEHNEKMIRERKIKMARNGEGHFWYEVEDNNEDDNLFYDGIEITQEARGKRISISQYFN